MNWRQVVKILAVATQVLTAVWLLYGVGVTSNDDEIPLLVGLTIALFVLVLNLAKSLRSADTVLPALKSELEKAELRLKLHRLNVQSRGET